MTRPGLAPRFLALALSAGLLASTSCATNPVTGKSQLALISEAQEIQMGREAHQEILQTIGAYDNPALQAYVSELGLRMARASERPHLPWTFTVLDDPIVNAFALPGGFIYVTRGILSHMTTEAELVSVLGHEIGHVTARHSVERLSKAQLAQIGLVAGMVLAEEQGAQYGQLAQAGLQVLFLHYSRDDERQADDLGFRYMNQAGYEPREMVEMFRLLGSVTAAAGGGGLPNWLASHPAPENRMGRIEEKIRTATPGTLGSQVAREPFLGQIDGIVFGEDPRQGYFVDNTFYQPEMAIQLRFPAGWTFDNAREAVSALAPAENAAISLSLATAASPAEAAEKFFSQQGLEAGDRLRDRIGGLPTAGAGFRANRPEGQEDLLGTVAFVQDGDRVYQLLAYTLEGQYSGYQRAFDLTLASLSRVRDRRYLDVQPKRVEVVVVRESQSLAELARRYPSTVDLPTLAIVNGVTPDGRLEAGARFKRVVGGQLPGR